MSWRLAYSLDTLRSQVNEAYPNRSKASDGTIGDIAHQAEASDHNPNSAGVVCAFDITNSPETGFDAHSLADRLLEVRHPDLKYIISNRRIAGAWSGWRWEPYGGSDPHDRHIHISVGVGPDGRSVQPYDDTIKWNVKEDIMSAVNDGDTTNYFLALFDRAPDQAELDKNRGKEWNNPDPSLRAPLYDDMIGRGRYLTEENKRLQKLVDQNATQYEKLPFETFKKKG